MGIFFLLYGVFRIAVEFLRVPDAQIGYLMGEWLTMGMVLSSLMLVAGAAMLYYAARTRHPQEGIPVFEGAEEAEETEEAEEALAEDPTEDSIEDSIKDLINDSTEDND